MGESHSSRIALEQALQAFQTSYYELAYTQQGIGGILDISSLDASRKQHSPNINDKCLQMLLSVPGNKIVPNCEPCPIGILIPVG